MFKVIIFLVFLINARSYSIKNSSRVFEYSNPLSVYPFNYISSLSLHFISRLTYLSYAFAIASSTPFILMSLSTNTRKYLQSLLTMSFILCPLSINIPSPSTFFPHFITNIASFYCLNLPLIPSVYILTVCIWTSRSSILFPNSFKSSNKYKNSKHLILSG